MIGLDSESVSFSSISVRPFTSHTNLGKLQTTNPCSARHLQTSKRLLPDDRNDYVLSLHHPYKNLFERHGFLCNLTSKAPESHMVVSRKKVTSS